MKSTLFTLAIFLLPSITFAAIFGIDDRSYTKGGSTAVGVLNTMHEPSGNGWEKIGTDSLSKYMCKEENFSQDPSIAYACTAFLVAPDLLVTAGHCMVNTGEAQNEPHGYCDVYSWLFDFEEMENGKVELNQIPSSRLYKCKQVVYAIKEDTAPFRDYALVQLERPVLDRKPLNLNGAASATFGPLSMVGYPMGTPAKKAINARILLNDSERQSYITTLDAFEGNSGSPVFNTNNEVVGILVGGLPSAGIIKFNGDKCYSFNHCNEAGQYCAVEDPDNSVFPGFQKVGSEVQRIAPLIELIQKFKGK